MANLDKTFDVILISFSDVYSDARTLNLCKSLVKLGKKIVLVCFTSQTKFEYYQNIGFPIVSIPESKRAKSYQKWIDFHKSAYKKIKDYYAINYVACDLYALSLARKLALKNNQKCIYDSREIYSQLGPLSKQIFKQKIISLIEKVFVIDVKKMIVSGDLDAMFLKKYFMHSVPYYTVLNLPWYEENQEKSSKFTLSKKDIILRDYNLDENCKFLIYQGRLLDGRGVDKAILAMKKLENYTLLILGDGPEEQKLKKLVEDNKINEKKNKVIFLGLIAYKELLEYTQIADIGLCLFEPISLSYNYALPNKLFEYIVSDIPVISSDLPAIRDVFEKLEFGVLIDKKFNDEDIYAAIIKLEDDNYYQKIKKQIKEAKLNYSYSSQEQVISKIFE